MAQSILNNLLTFKIQPKEIIEWLTTDNFKHIDWVEFNKTCQREEFIMFFLNYLRNQFTSEILAEHNFTQVPSKKILSLSRLNRNNKSTKIELKKINENNGIYTNYNVSDIENEISSISQQSNTTSIYCNSIYEQKTGSNSSICINNIETVTKCGMIDNRGSIGTQYGFENLNFISPVQSPSTSTPVIKKKNSIHKKRVELISSDLSQRHNFNAPFEGSFEYENVSYNRNINFDQKAFPNLVNISSNKFNISNLLVSLDKKESLDSLESNILEKSNSSLPNKILQTPVSPLYNHSISTFIPTNVKTSKTSIGVKNTSDNIKASRQSISLADFIVREPPNSKKAIVKRNNRRLYMNDDQKNISTLNSSSDTSSHADQSTRRRKVNPTRINHTDGKGNQANSVFEDVSRPYNPNFTDVSPIDKSVDNVSFQVERRLVKIERQKKSQAAITENADVNTDITNININLNLTECLNIQPRYTILPRTPTQVIESGLIIIPNKASVNSRDVLDILAELYSGFLDHNLIVNPMTELYFLVYLITATYTDTKKRLFVAMDKSNQNEISSINYKNKSSDNKKLLLLKKSLNFDDSLDEKTDECINLNENISDSNITGFESNFLNLKDTSGSSLNLVNTKLKHCSINKDIDESFCEFKEENRNEESKKMYFGTPHNCVYFSTQVLHRQKTFLKCLDRVTLKLLYQNNHIATFHSELCQYLNKIYDLKVAEKNKIKSSLNIGPGELNVCFQKDTDNRETFPSNESFLDFKKQRDMFYEVLKTWEDNHLVSGWSFQIALSGRIKTMLAIHTDITNFTHFAQLFKSQMLISCIQSGKQDILDDETLSFLKNLKNSNPEKLTQLQRKLVTPLSYNGPVPSPSFPGIQEFYKDFILCATHPMFYTYLEDTFICEIMELSNSQFTGSDIEETANEVDEQTKRNFIVCLSRLKLLSKFLGFITSLPYRSETSTLEHVIDSQISLRSMCLPRMDLQYCLQTAIIQGKLSLIVPWVVEYLAMMDHASLRLPYYKKVLEILYYIYRASSHHTAIDLEESMSQRTFIMVKLVIGWLFELPVFPKEFYYIWQSQYNNQSLKFICESQQQIIKLDCSLTGPKSPVKHCIFLDKLDIVDDEILYSCCPFLRELNVLLTPGNSNVNNNIAFKHVTPVTSQLQKSTEKTSAKYIEIQLEEAFFHGQPTSTAKTVEYVAERVASSCVKYIYSNLLPFEKKKNSEILRKAFEDNYFNNAETNFDTLKNSLLKDMNSLASKAVLNLKVKCRALIPNICESRINQSIHALLAEDSLQPVKDMCIKISMRMAIERIDQWILSHITGGCIFIKDMEMELSRAFKNIQETFLNKENHNPNTASPTEVINNTRKMIWDLLETKGQMLNTIRLMKVLDEIYESLTERCDLKLLSKNVISSLSLDLCLFLITYRADLFTIEIQEKVLNVWKINSLDFSKTDSSLLNILSSRNIFLLSSGNESVWSNFGKLLKKLLKEDILSIDSLNEQAVALLRVECPVSIMKNLSICLKEAIDGYTSSDEYTERIKQLLEWVAGACNDMDKEAFDFL